MIGLLALAAAQAADPCAHDRAALLALPLLAFDQDLSGGWRPLAERGCEKEAADLIRDWRVANKSDQFTLFWHEGQMRAYAGQTAAAIALLDGARRPATEDLIGWNHYVDGSVAFLRRDRPALAVARARLAVLPKPPGFDPRGPDGKPRPTAWPVNLRVLDGFIRCWAQSYKVAYGCPAR